MLAAEYGRSDIARMLLDSGADPDAATGEGITGVMLAAKEGHSSLVAELLNHSNARGMSSSTAPTRAGKDEHLTTGDPLLWKGPLLESQDSGTSTPPMEEHNESTNKISQAGARVDAFTNQGYTALMFASLSGYPEVVRTLIIHGAGIDASTNQGRTALMMAAQEGHSLCVRSLLLYGANVDGITIDGLSALMQATKTGKPACVATLLAGGANKWIRDRKGITAFEIAFSMKDTECMKLLKNGGDATNISVFGSLKGTCGQMVEAIRHCPQSLHGDHAFLNLRFPSELVTHVLLQQDAGTIGPPMNMMLTITGSGSVAYATTCERYVLEVWGELGLAVTNTIWRLVASGGSCEIPRVCKLHIDKGSVRDSYHTIRVTQLRHRAVAIAVGQILAWLSATFRPSVEISSCLSSVNIFTHRNAETIIIQLEDLQRTMTHKPSSCWVSLFPGVCIAEGFPVRSPDRLGVDIPFDVMIHATRMLYATDMSAMSPTETLDPEIEESSVSSDSDSASRSISPAEEPSFPAEGIFFTGVKALLYPVESDQNENPSYVKWHYEKARDSLFPAEESWCRIKTMDELRNAACFLGFTSHATVHLGTETRKGANETMNRTRASRRKGLPELAIDQIGLGIGVVGGHTAAQATFKFQVPSYLPLSRDTEDVVYDDILEMAAEQPVILYDTTPGLECGWLVSELSLILEMIHFKAKQKGWALPYYASPKPNGAVAARHVLSCTDFADKILYTRLHDNRKRSTKHVAVDIYKEIIRRRQYDQLHQRLRGSKSFGRHKLYGWDLLELTEPSKGSYPRQFPVHVAGDPLATTYPSWMRLAKDCTVYFCENLGQVIVPANSLCRICARQQPNRQHLVASLHALSLLFTSQECCYHLDNGLIWDHRDDGLFKPCYKRSCCNKDRVQMFRKNHAGHCPDKGYARASLPPDGAVIFGETRTAASELNGKLERGKEMIINSLIGLSIEPKSEKASMHQYSRRRAESACREVQ